MSLFWWLPLYLWIQSHYSSLKNGASRKDRQVFNNNPPTLYHSLYPSRENSLMSFKLQCKIHRTPSTLSPREKSTVMMDIRIELRCLHLTCHWNTHKKCLNLKTLKHEQIRKCQKKMSSSIVRRTILPQEMQSMIDMNAQPPRRNLNLYDWCAHRRRIEYSHWIAIAEEDTIGKWLIMETAYNKLTSFPCNLQPNREKKTMTTGLRLRHTITDHRHCNPGSSLLEREGWFSRSSLVWCGSLSTTSVLFPHKLLTKAWWWEHLGNSWSPKGPQKHLMHVFYSSSSKVVPMKKM